MTRKCGKCGIPAPDDEARFCNRCGSEIIEVIEKEFPTCPSCGTVVSDELAEFCNRCGTRIPQAPPVCPGCGREALDPDSLFCTRCGTHFDKSRKSPAGSRAASRQPPAPSVVVKQKKPAAARPREEEPAPDWDPWTEDAPVPAPSPAAPPESGHKKYAHLPLDAMDSPRTSHRQDSQIAMPSKKYAHLPLIADELKDRYNRPSADYDAPAEEFPPPTGKGRKPPQKKGMMGLFKK